MNLINMSFIRLVRKCYKTSGMFILPVFLWCTAELMNSEGNNGLAMVPLLFLTTPLANMAQSKLASSELGQSPPLPPFPTDSCFNLADCVCHVGKYNNQLAIS